MIFSQKCEYAIRALVHLAESHRASRAREISDTQNISFSFVSKILQELKAKGFVRSTRGASGGFTLVKPASAVRLMDVFLAMDGDKDLTGCLYGLGGCSDDNPCPLHEGWKDVRAKIESCLLSHTLSDLATQPSRTNPGANPRS